MRIEFVEVDAKATENTDSACAFGFALADILQISLVGRECSVKFRRRWEVLLFGINCTLR